MLPVQDNTEAEALARGAMEAFAVGFAAITRLAAMLSDTFEAPVKPPLNAPQTREEALAAHRRAHRMGVPGKIEGDPELEAFILARIDSLTYAEIVAEVKAHFPADRQTSASAVQRWFRKRHNGGAAR